MSEIRINPLALARRYGFEGESTDGYHIVSGMLAPWDAIKRMAIDRAMLAAENQELRNRLSTIFQQRADKAELARLHEQKPIGYINKGVIATLKKGTDLYPGFISSIKNKSHDVPLYVEPKPAQVPVERDPICLGDNCKSTRGVGHSAECISEHEKNNIRRRS